MPGVPLAFGEGDTKSRIKNIANWKMPDKKHLSIISVCVAILMVCLLVDPTSAMPSEHHGYDPLIYKEETPSQHSVNKQETTLQHSINKEEIQSEHSANKEETLLQLSMDMEEHYITSTGDPTNLYYIDENNVLWGRGENNYGQLGQGFIDTQYHEEAVQIAEHVIHVDYSQK